MESNEGKIEFKEPKNKRGFRAEWFYEVAEILDELRNHAIAFHLGDLSKDYFKVIVDVAFKKIDEKLK
jgi:hypothetical protein